MGPQKRDHDDRRRDASRGRSGDLSGLDDLEDDDDDLTLGRRFLPQLGAWSPRTRKLVMGVLLVGAVAFAALVRARTQVAFDRKLAHVRQQAAVAGAQIDPAQFFRAWSASITADGPDRPAHGGIAPELEDATVHQYTATPTKAIVSYDVQAVYLHTCVRIERTADTTTVLTGGCEVVASVGD